MDRPYHSDGFSLVEVLVALALLSGTLALSYQVLADRAVSARTIEARTIARLHLQSLTDQLGILITLDEGQQSGTFDDGYRWSVTVAPHEGAAKLPDFVTRHITLRVEWENGRALSVSTQRLVRSSQ